MTDYGLRIRNDTNNIIIDSKYKNFSYYDSNISNLNNGLNEISITPTPNNLILAIKPPTNTYVLPFGFKDTTETGTFESIVLYSGDTCSCPWLLYNDNESIISGNYGFKVKNSDNKIVFNSNEKGYTNLVGFYQYNSIVDLNIYIDVTVNNADDNYFQFLGGAYYSQGTGTTTDNYLWGLKKINSTTIRIGFIKIDSYSSSNNSVQSGAYGPAFIFEFKKPPSI